MTTNATTTLHFELYTSLGNSDYQTVSAETSGGFMDRQLVEPSNNEAEIIGAIDACLRNFSKEHPDAVKHSGKAVFDAFSPVECDHALVKVTSVVMV